LKIHLFYLVYFSSVIKGNQTEMASAENLPNDLIWLLLTKYVDPLDAVKCLRVCKKWKNAVKVENVQVRAIKHISIHRFKSSVSYFGYLFLCSQCECIHRSNKCLLDIVYWNKNNTELVSGRGYWSDCGIYTASEVGYRLKLEFMREKTMSETMHRLSEVCKRKIYNDRVEFITKAASLLLSGGGGVFLFAYWMWK